MTQQEIMELIRDSKSLSKLSVALKQSDADSALHNWAMRYYLDVKARERGIPLKGTFEITPLCNLLEINFAIIESNGLGMDVILKDSEDFSRQLTVSFCEGKKGFTKVVCDTQTATASGEFFYNTVRPCTFSISQDGGLKDYTLGTLFRISRYDDGRAFDMFLGRKVYVGLRFHGSGSLKILSLNGQSFQNTATDRISPNLVVSGHVSDRAEKNGKVILP